MSDPGKTPGGKVDALKAKIDAFLAEHGALKPPAPDSQKTPVIKASGLSIAPANTMAGIGSGKIMDAAGNVIADGADGNVQFKGTFNPQSFAGLTFTTSTDLPPDTFKILNTLSLANAKTTIEAGGGQVAKYVHAAINADWDPKDHPRDPHTGEFMKTPGGYIFGKAKSANFKTDSGLKDISLDLAPGDVAFRTPGKNVIVSHGDGSYTLHNAATGEVSTIPAGSHSEIAAWSQEGKLTKVAENPGTILKAATQAEAEAKIADPAAHAQAETPKIEGGATGLTTPPALKPGKTKYTAKQYSAYQAENEGKTIGTDADGKPVASGSWVDYKGTPYKVYASPHGSGHVTSYKWVKTKQQAANEVKEDAFDLAGAKAIDDPTGKPYGVEAAKPEPGKVSLGTGSLMSQADTAVAVPNASVAHAKHLSENEGAPLDADGDPNAEGTPLTDANGAALHSGDWVEIGGKPYQVHSSPNKGNIALKKWVGTKQQAATTSYDFPAGSLTANGAVKIDDPTGKPYVPLPKSALPSKKSDTAEPKAETQAVAKKVTHATPPKKKPSPKPAPEAASAPEAVPQTAVGDQFTSLKAWGNAPAGTMVHAEYDTGAQGYYTKQPDGSWETSFGNKVDPMVVMNMKDTYGATFTVVSGIPESVPDLEPEPTDPTANLKQPGDWYTALDNGDIDLETVKDAAKAQGPDSAPAKALQTAHSLGEVGIAHLEEAGVQPKLKAVGSINYDGTTYYKMNDGSWASGVAADGSYTVVPSAEQPHGLDAAYGDLSALKTQFDDMEPGDTLYATHIASGKVSTYEMQSDGMVHATGSGQTVTLEKMAGIVAAQWNKFDFDFKKKADPVTTALDHVAVAQPGDTLEWGYKSFNPDVYTKQPDGSWHMIDPVALEADSELEPTVYTTDEVLAQLTNNGPGAAYLTFTKAPDPWSPTSGTPTAAPSPSNVLKAPDGSTVILKPGDKVYQSNDFPDLYAVVDVLNGATIYNEYGKQDPVDLNDQDLAKQWSKYWTEVDTWPGKVDGDVTSTPATEPPAEAGATDKILADVTDNVHAFDPTKAAVGDVLTLSGGDGDDSADETFTKHGATTWVQYSPSNPDNDMVWTDSEVKTMLENLVPNVEVFYSTDKSADSPAHPFATDTVETGGPVVHEITDGSNPFSLALITSAKEGDSLAIVYEDGLTDTLHMGKDGQWLTDDGDTAYSSVYLSDIIDGTVKGILTLNQSSTLTAEDHSPASAPEPAENAIPESPTLASLLDDGKPTQALKDAKNVYINSSNIADAPVGTKVKYEGPLGNVYTKGEDGLWHYDSAAGSFTYDDSDVLAGLNNGNLEPTYDFSGVALPSDGPDLTPKPPTAPLVFYASPGDKVSFKIAGVDHTYVKSHPGYWDKYPSGMKDISTAVVWALIKEGTDAVFTPGGNDHTATKKPSDSGNVPDGISEGLGTVKKPAAKTPNPSVPAKGKGAAKSAADTHVTLPDGTEYDLKPGEAFGYLEFYGNGGYSKSDIYVHVTAAGPNKVWNKDGQQISVSLTDWQPTNKALAKMTPTGLKSAITKGGGSLYGLNAYKKPKIDAKHAETYGTFDDATDATINGWIESSKPTPDTYTWNYGNPFATLRTAFTNMIHGGVVSTAGEYWAKPGEPGYKGVVPLSYYGLDAYKPFYPNPNADQPGANPLLAWSEMDPMQQAEVVGRMAPLAAGFHNLIADAYDGVDLEKKQKSRLTANKNALLGILRMAELAQAITDPDSTKTGGWTMESLEAELGEVQKWHNGPKSGLKDFDSNRLPAMEMVTALNLALQKRKFTEGLSGLDFDPLNASTAEYDAYAKSKGFEHLSLLSPADQMTWVLADLGDPSIGASQKNAVANNLAKAKQKVALATLSASLSSQAQQSPADVVESAPAVGASPLSVTKTKQDLKKSYSWVYHGHGSQTLNQHATLTHTGEDEWSWTTESGPNAAPSTITITDAMALQVLNSIKDDLTKGTGVYSSFKESKFPAYAGVTPAQSIKDKFAEHGIDVGGYFEKSALKAMSDNLVFDQAPAILAAAVAEGWTDESAGEAIPQLPLNFLAAKASGMVTWDYQFTKQWDSYNGIDLANHPGNPDHPQGKAAWEALYAKIASIPGGKEYLAGAGPESVAATMVASKLGVPNALIPQWVSNHTAEDLAPFATHAYGDANPDQVTDLKPGTSNAEQPTGVDDQVWNIVLNAGDGTDVSDLVGVTVANYSDADLDSALAEKTSIPFAGVPKPLKQLALWGAQGYDANSIEERSQFLTAVKARVSAGDFLSADTAVWTHPQTGAKFPISPGATVYEYTPSYGSPGYLVTGPPTGVDGKPTHGFFFAANDPTTPQKKSGYTLTGMVDDPGTKTLIEVPDPVTFDKAKNAKDISVTQEVWDTVEKMESGKIYQSSLTGALLTADLKNGKNGDYLKKNYPAIWAQKTTLPEQVRGAISEILSANVSTHDKTKNVHDPYLDLIEFKAANKHYASMGSQGLFDAGQPWNAYLSKGLLSPADVGKWSTTATDAYLSHFGLKDVSQISPHLNGILNPELPVPEAKVSWKNLPDFNSLTLTNTGKNPGGMHSKSVWVDQTGEEWMSKAFNSDPNAKARVDAETNANKIGALFGFGNPVAETVALTNSGKVSGAGTGEGAGNYTYFQHMKPAVGSFSNKAPGDLSTKQLQQAMSHHVLDWIVSNHDTHSENLLVGTDGNVFGIDLGQAFKFFPNDKLAVGYLPPGNGAPVWYDQFYNALKNGTIDKATADDVVKHVLRTAQRVAKSNDAEYKALLEDALKNRESFPPQYATREKFIDALMERKHNTLDDFVDLYKGLYAQSPYEWDIDPENLTPPKVGNAHIAVTSDLTKSVKKSKAIGQALMVNSLDIEDAYLMLSTQQDKSGSHLLLGEAKVRKDGDVKLTAWFKKQTVVNQTGYNSSDYGNSAFVPPSGEPAYAVLPSNADLFGAMVAYSKTVSTHNVSGDHQYNETTVKNATSYKSQMDQALSMIEKWEKANPGKPMSGSVGSLGTVDLATMEQHDAYKQMLQTYVGYFDKVKAAEGTDQKISPHFTQVVYSPSVQAKESYLSSKGLPPSAADAEQGTSLTWKQGSVTYVATKDLKTGWTLKTTIGSNEPSTETISDTDVEKVMWAVPDVKSTSEQASAKAEDEVSTQVKVGTKVLKVTLKNAAYPKSTFNHETGEQDRIGGESTAGFANSGQMYEVDFGNVKITYRPWDPTYGVAKAQQGLLKFEKSDFDGDDASAPASVNEILDVLKQMGLDLDAADETSLETYYWAHMAGVLADRKDGSNSKWGKVNAHLKANLSESMSDDERLNTYREAWAQALGQDRVDQVVSSGWWKPRFSHASFHALEENDIEDGEVKADAETSGRPYWFRPDLTMEELYAKVGDNSPSSSLTYGGQWADASLIATSGASLSSEERARYYGHQAKGGASSGSDAGYGSSGYVFMRSNSTDHLGNSGQVYYHPRVYLRTTNYGFDSDNYGNTEYRKTQSTWDPANTFSHKTEYLTKSSVSVLSDYAILTFQTESERQAAIKAYKAKGITMINGIPIEEFFHTGTVDAKTYKSIIQRLWKKAIEDEKQTAEAFA